MTKKELLELLKDVPDDGLIVVHGHSDGGGYNDCFDVEEKTITRTVPSGHTWNWRGQYEEPWKDTKPEDIIKAYVIN